jgi:hypothetical protein
MIEMRAPRGAACQDHPGGNTKAKATAALKDLFDIGWGED